MINEENEIIVCPDPYSIYFVDSAGYQYEQSFVTCLDEEYYLKEVLPHAKYGWLAFEVPKSVLDGKVYLILSNNEHVSWEVKFW